MNGIGEPKALDAPGDLLDLLARMGTRITRIGSKLIKLSHHDLLNHPSGLHSRFDFSKTTDSSECDQEHTGTK